MVLHELFEKHRWSIKDFMRHFVTAEPIKKFGVSCSVRAKTLSNAIYQQEEVVEQLSRVSKDVHIMNNEELIKRLRAELHAVSKSEIGLGMFDSEKDVIDLDIPALAERVSKAAPELWALLSSLMESPYTSSQRDTLTACKGSMVMICSILTHSRAPRKSNNLPMLLGLHLHSMGVKRRTINLLAGLGIISSYHTINDRRGELAEIGKVPILSCIYFSSLSYSGLLIANFM